MSDEGVLLEESPAPERAARPGLARRIFRAVRWCGVAVLCLTLTISIVGAVATMFARDQLLDTGNFVARAAPLARDPAIQDAVTKRVTNQIADTLDVDALSDKSKDWVSEADPPKELEPAVRSAVSGLREYVSAEVREFVHSDEFARTWDSAIRAAHTETVKVLDRQQGEVLRHKGTALSVELGPVVTSVKSQLVDSGFELAEKIPRLNPKLSLMDSDLVPRSQEYTHQLRTAADWLPWIAVASLGLLILLAPLRRRAVMIAGAMVGLVGLTVAAAAWVARDRYLSGLDDAVIPAVVRALTAGLVPQYVLIAVGSVMVALSCFVLGRVLSHRTAD